MDSFPLYHYCQMDLFFLDNDQMGTHHRLLLQTEHHHRLFIQTGKHHRLFRQKGTVLYLSSQSPYFSHSHSHILVL